LGFRISKYRGIGIRLSSSVVNKSSFSMAEKGRCQKVNLSMSG
jgi:hypothetical protein